MKRLIEILGRLLLFACFALACTIAFCGAVIYTLEKSGWLADMLRSKLRGELAQSGTDFDVEDIELDWFTPGVTLQGLALGVDGRLARINRATRFARGRDIDNGELYRERNGTLRNRFFGSIWLHCHSGQRAYRNHYDTRSAG